MSQEERYMALALSRAARGLGRTSPNPAVGAVVVAKGDIVGLDHHRKAGEPHAEVLALRQAGDRARGADLYVNLEPCSHHGRTGPCTECIVRSGVARVIVGMADPNPLVDGSGMARLRQAGVEVVEGVLQEQSRHLNRAFIKHITTGLPWVLAKAAMTLDGKIATHEGESRWISSPESRLLVHRLRNRYDAVMVGRTTALKDNPQLTTRLPGGKGRDPLRVIVDSRLRLSPQAAMLRQSSRAATLVACTTEAGQERSQALQAAGAEVLPLSACPDGRVPLEGLLRALGSKGVLSVMVEGGGELLGSLLDQGLLDEALLFLAPKLVGGRQAPTGFDGQGQAQMERAWPLEDIKVSRRGGDIMVQGMVGRKGLS